jgi:L-alanine-DL-glutamate epimerase-like enolase superfamily enzyme
VKITEVEAFLMSYVMPRPILLPFWGGTRSILKRDAMLIRLRTDTGLTGYAPGPAHERAAAEIRARIRAFLLGKDPLDWRSFDFSASPQTRTTYRAVEIALMDLAARHEGCPLSELLGGRQRDRIQLYGSAGMYMAPEQFAEEAAAIAALGFPAYKMRPALGPDRDLETVERMRQAVGPDFGLMIDAHSWWRMGVRSYSFETVADLSRSMAASRRSCRVSPAPRARPYTRRHRRT